MWPDNSILINPSTSKIPLKYWSVNSINWYNEGSATLMDSGNPDIASNEVPSMQMMFEAVQSLSNRVDTLEKEKIETADKMKKLENENTELKAQVEANKSRLSIRRKTMAAR